LDSCYLRFLRAAQILNSNSCFCWPFDSCAFTTVVSAFSSRRFEEVFSQLQALQQSSEHEFEQLENEMKNCLFELENKHIRETDAFREKWQNPAFFAQYQKPSPELLQMRYIERRLALKWNYEEAKAKRDIADKQQKRKNGKLQH
jgi:hypothetical protein